MPLASLVSEKGGSEWGRKGERGGGGKRSWNLEEEGGKKAGRGRPRWQEQRKR